MPSCGADARLRVGVGEKQISGVSSYKGTNPIMGVQTLVMVSHSDDRGAIFFTHGLSL